jgi:hypothetical protein
VHEQKVVKAGDPFFSEVHVDTGNDKLAEYEITFEYDAEHFDVNKGIGINGLEAGGNGFITSVDIPEPGKIIARGLYIYGKLPNRDFYLLNIHWIARKKGKSRICVTVNNMVTPEKEVIGTLKGGFFKVSIK